MALYDVVNGVYRKVSKKYDPVNGIYRKVKAAYDPVDGVYRKYFSGNSAIAGGMAPGDSVWLKVGGALTEFLVVHQGNPDPALYDASCDGTWLLSKNVLSLKTWDEDWGDPNDERDFRPADNYYGDSVMHNQWLNYEFINSIDSNVKAHIRQVKIPYWNSVGSDGSLSSGASGLSTKSFLLSGYEVGWTTAISTKFPADGACLDYFKGAPEQDAKRVASYNGAAAEWWLRSPYTAGDRNVITVHKVGTWSLSGCFNEEGFRPAFILDSSTAVVQSNGINIIE